MGNRAAVIFAAPDREFSPPVYVHDNGGPESIVAFLDYMAAKHCRMAGDPTMGAARLAQVAANFFGGTLSVRILNYEGETWQEVAKLAAMTAEDNGCYIVLAGKGDKPYTLVKENGKRVNLAAARQHPYWQGEKNILAVIAEANDAHFTEKEPA